MGESVVRSSTTSGRSAAKPHELRRNVRGSRGPLQRKSRLDRLFRELARLAEMSVVERRLTQIGFRRIAGTDEVGRGCLAGPVVAAAVILDPSTPLLGVDDSKKLSPGDRFVLFRSILQHSVAISVGVVESATIDRINILEASKLAMKRAVDHLPVRPDVLLLDAVSLDQLQMPQVSLIKGDSRSIAIAAASIVAKIYRDTLMEAYHDHFPQYDFVHNRGYGTEAHRQALIEFGPCPIHRMTFEGLSGGRLFD